MGQPLVNGAGDGSSGLPPLDQIREALRSPYLPSSITALADAEGYLETIWPHISSSLDTAGWIGSALYVADMALDTVERVYEPILTLDDLADAGLSEGNRSDLAEMVDVFHYVQPQVLLLLAALAEAFERDEVGGHGKVEPRPTTPRETRHRAISIPWASPDTPPLPEVVEVLGVDEPPDLYRALASYPKYLETAWQELQHLAAFPEFRRRGRALYFYARSGARFLAEPLSANPTALRKAGLSDGAIETARATIDQALPATAMMVMHAEAVRASLRIASREVVQAEGQA